MSTAGEVRGHAEVTGADGIQDDLVGFDLEVCAEPLHVLSQELHPIAAIARGGQRPCVGERHTGVERIVLCGALPPGSCLSRMARPFSAVRE